ncbi:MAG: sulfatase-like hydrolase/transferase [Halioglobus sp.]
MTNSGSKRSIHSQGMLALFFLAIIASISGCGEEKIKPNILLIMLDDFGYNDLALNNGSDSPTPTLDQIAQEGIRFTRHYTETTCTPSRVALLTGRYSARAGAHPDLSGIDHEIVTLPDVLGDNGYTNYMIGKWHAGDAHRESRPEYQGFDHWFGFMSQIYLMGPHTKDGYVRKKPTYKNPWLENEHGDLRKRKGHLTDLVTDHTIKVIKTEKDPWFIYLAYYAPHSPIEPSKAYKKRHPKNSGGKYQALKDQLDTNLSRILTLLEERGELENTMIVIASDNGGTAKTWPSNLPFNGVKATQTEGGVRTPLILHWPDGWPGNEQRDNSVAIFDIYPTILSALGIAHPNGLDGVDIFSATRERVFRWYSHSLYGDTMGMLSKDGKWRLITWDKISDLLQNETDFVDLTPQNRFDENAELGQGMKAAMSQWVQEVTTIKDLQVSYDDAWASFTGSAFRRTPLGGTHTMGFTFKRGTAKGLIEEQLVAQQDYIDIRASGSSINIMVDSNQLEIPAPKSQDCFTIVIRSSMAKSNMIFYRDNYRSQTRVYVNGELEKFSSYDNPVLNKTTPKNPLRVNISPGNPWYMPSGTTPFLSTRAATEKEIATSIESQLAQSCEA